MGWRFSLRLGVLTAVALAASLPAVPTRASTASEEQQGTALVKAITDGKRPCNTLSSTDFERIGEYTWASTPTPSPSTTQ